MDGSSPIFKGFNPGDEERIAAARREHRFFWIDLIAHEASPALDALQVPRHARARLLESGTSEPPSRKFHADTEHVVFPFPYVRRPSAPVAEGPGAIDATEAGVLVHGDYILTVHRSGYWLTEELELPPAPHRSERYRVYAVLDGMLWTVFEALDSVENEMQGLENDVLAGRGSHTLRRDTVENARGRLAVMRRLLAPQRGIFERVSEEVGRVRGLEGDPDIPEEATGYVERIGSQLSRLVDDIDSSARDLASLIDLGISETNYRLTIVATIFLPLTALTGFFGMNFAWLVDHAENDLVDFLIWGIALPVLFTAATYWLISRGQRMLSARARTRRQAAGAG
jgi:magnesium transporter